MLSAPGVALNARDNANNYVNNDRKPHTSLAYAAWFLSVNRVAMFVSCSFFWTEADKYRTGFIGEISITKTSPCNEHPVHSTFIK